MTDQQLAHSTLGASSAKRWMACPGSVRLIKTVPVSEDTEHAKEGTAAHALAAMCLGKWVESEGRELPMPAVQFVGEEDPETGVEYSIDMANAVQVYLDWAEETFGQWLRDGDAIVMVEQRVSLEALGPEAKGMFGTSDLIVYRKSTRHVFSADYKHGKGVTVEVTDNVQTKYYTLGAQLKLDVPIDKATSVIVQPRKEHADGYIREHTIDCVDLIEFSIELVDAAVRTRDPKAPLCAGDHCRDSFCDAQAVCPANQDRLFREAKIEFSDGGDIVIPDEPLEQVPAEQLVQILSMKSAFEAYLSSIEQYLHGRLEAGDDVTGGAMKLVEKRAVRKWGDDDKTVVATLQKQFKLDRDDIVTEKVASPAQVEKLLSKDQRAQLNELTVKESSGTTLVMASDKRPAITPGGAAAEFGHIED